MKWVDMPFPCSGLVYPKMDEKLPFMTWAEIERRIKAGGDADTLWECLYLDAHQVAAMLKNVKAKELSAWIFPMLAMAAHTGARRSELIRARVEDVDLEAGVITLREKKRSRGTRTSRRVPVSSLLAGALRSLLDEPGRAYLFGDGQTPLSVQVAHNTFERAVRGTKWQVIKGWHTLRHGFISAMASKGVDQRIIDDCVGHCTEEQRRRYALYRMGYHSRTTGHGFRSTASTILNEKGFAPDVIERQLAHSERNSVRAAYNHAQYLPERRKMMQWWADYLAEIAAKK